MSFRVVAPALILAVLSLPTLRGESTQSRSTALSSHASSSVGPAPHTEASASDASPADLVAAASTGLRYRMIGPHRGGRTKAAAGIPDQPNVFFVGAVNGGVW